MIRILNQQIPSSGRRLNHVERQRLHLLNISVERDASVHRVANDYSFGIVQTNNRGLINVGL